MNLKFFTNLETLEQHSQQWDAVAGDFPFFRFDWMGNWLRHLGTSYQPAVLVATDDTGNWLGIAPWCIDHENGMIRKLRWLSSGAACGDYLKLITNPEHTTKFATTAADWLVENIGNNDTLGHLDSIELEGIALADDDASFVVELLEANGLQSHSVELEGCWKVTLPSDWSALESQCSKSMRRKTKKAVKRLTDAGTKILTTDDSDFEQRWENFIVLHQQRRQSLGQSGCFAHDNFTNFLKAATRGLIATGHAEIIEIQHDGRPLASTLLLNDRNTVYMYQSGSCNERSAMEPGYQMVACAIQRSIEAGHQAFDFLRGDEPYKARWNTERVGLSRVKFVPQVFSAQLKHSLWLTGRSIKQCFAPSGAN
jgi:CelD/BcsL family acetyltransferase involved in cellulose biosynthesis